MMHYNSDVPTMLAGDASASGVVISHITLSEHPIAHVPLVRCPTLSAPMQEEALSLIFSQYQDISILVLNCLVNPRH